MKFISAKQVSVAQRKCKGVHKWVVGSSSSFFISVDRNKNMLTIVQDKDHSFGEQPQTKGKDGLNLCGIIHWFLKSSHLKNCSFWHFHVGFILQPQRLPPSLPLVLGDHRLPVSHSTSHPVSCGQSGGHYSYAVIIHM